VRGPKCRDSSVLRSDSTLLETHYQSDDMRRQARD